MRESTPKISLNHTHHQSQCKVSPLSWGSYTSCLFFRQHTHFTHHLPTIYLSYLPTHFVTQSYTLNLTYYIRTYICTHILFLSFYLNTSHSTYLSLSLWLSNSSALTLTLSPFLLFLSLSITHIIICLIFLPTFMINATLSFTSSGIFSIVSTKHSTRLGFNPKRDAIVQYTRWSHNKLPE